MQRRVGEEIGIAVINRRALSPDRRIETGRQAGFELLGRKGIQARVVFDISGALLRIEDAAAVRIPVDVCIEQPLEDIVSQRTADVASSPCRDRARRRR